MGNLLPFLVMSLLSHVMAVVNAGEHPRMWNEGTQIRRHVGRGGTIYENSSSASSYTGVRNVLDFGVKGDGTTDDSASFQTALNSLKPGETLLIPPGNYSVAELVIPDVAEITLQGICGGGSFGLCSTLTLRMDPRNRTLPRFLMASWNYANNLTWTGATCTVSRLGFAGPNKGGGVGPLTATGPPGLVLMSWSTTVEECSFYGFGSTGLMAAAAGQSGVPITSTQVNNRYYRNNFFNNAGHGFLIDDPDRNKNTDYFLKDNFAFSNGKSGFHLDTSAGGLISGNHFYGNGGFDLTIGIGSIACRIMHNYLEGPNGLHVMTMNPDVSIQLQGNVFEGRAVLTANDGNSTVVSTGNTFANTCTQSGDWLTTTTTTTANTKARSTRSSFATSTSSSSLTSSVVGCMQLRGYRGHVLTLRSVNDFFFSPGGDLSPKEKYLKDGSVKVLTVALVEI